MLWELDELYRKLSQQSLTHISALWKKLFWTRQGGTCLYSQPSVYWEDCDMETSFCYRAKPGCTEHKPNQENKTGNFCYQSTVLNKGNFHLPDWQRLSSMTKMCRILLLYHGQEWIHAQFLWKLSWLTKMINVHAF